MSAQDNDTMVAIATADGRGGIGVVRLSGPRARSIAESLVDAVQPLEAGRAKFAHIVHDGEVMDEAVLTFFATPRSYTGEDVVEISAHGAPVLLDWMVRAALAAGARPARAGEFTERAFLNGRLDLTQAEAVRDLIEANTLEQARVAARQLGGSLAKEIRPVKQALVGLISGLEAGIDFAEDDIDVMPRQEIATRIAQIGKPLQALAASFAYGRVLRQGATIAIVGRPNAGKSSLFNRLVRRERAIVTAQPGTTRDLVTETTVLEERGPDGEQHGIPVHLVDTAGLREASYEAEALGIAKSREALAEADVALVVLDASVELNGEERALLADATLQPRAVIVWNKIDLAGDARKLEESGVAPSALRVSALTGAGIDTLVHHLLGILRGPADMAATPLTNLRQQQTIETALAALSAAAAGVAEQVPHEMLLLDLYRALKSLDELTGETTTEDILALIFSSFCIGK